jgi:hypothetical protein
MRRSPWLLSAILITTAALAQSGADSGSAPGAGTGASGGDPVSLIPPSLRLKKCVKPGDSSKAPVDSGQVIALFNACALGGSAVTDDCSCTCWDGTKVTLAAVAGGKGPASCPPLGSREIQDTFESFAAIQPRLAQSLRQAENLLEQNLPPAPATH